MTDYTKEKAYSKKSIADSGKGAASGWNVASAAPNRNATSDALSRNAASTAPSRNAASDASGAKVQSLAASAPGIDSNVAQMHIKRRIIGRVLFALIIAITIALMLVSTPLFSISEIVVNGNNYYSSSAIISKSGLRIGDNGFSTLLGGNALTFIAFRCTPAEQAIISSCPYIKTIHARYELPRTILIDIEERNSSFIVPYFGSGLLIDGEGVIVDIMRDYRQSELPVAQGLPVERYDIGKSLITGDDLRVSMVLAVINAIKQADRESDDTMAWKVSEIDVSDLRSIMISMSNGIQINLGDGTEMYYRVSAAKEIMSYGIVEGEDGLIIFSNGARPVFVPNKKA